MILSETPLAERMRPLTLEEYCGQPHLMGENAPLRRLIETGRVPSCVLYGPPGVGKTTLVRLIARATQRSLLEINAVTAKVAELRDLVEEAKRLKIMGGGTSALAFIDELYHFNSSQQNVLLPSVEKGDLILIGTTTENPRYEINKTLLSRMIIFDLKPLTPEELLPLLRRAMEDKTRGLGDLEVRASDEILLGIATASGGDVRQALTRLEASVSFIAATGGTTLTSEAVEQTVGSASVRFDRKGDDHYSIISAMIKSIRGSDPDAAVYWLARLLAGGEDIRFICRRILISAAEDIGLADPAALQIAAAATFAADMTGLPEARIILSEAVIYLAAAPKSNSAYLAVDRASAEIEKGVLQAVPHHLKPDGSGYLYPHDDPRHWLPQQYMESPRRYYYPGSLGYEQNIAARLKKFWRRFLEEN
ncbi:MAG: replication-associated recombination protein A [Synergistaceae bacterium]|jgi:putative ATPase|nr:replication-associated recombination protein A [Synergistaceae bacterium]